MTFWISLVAFRKPLIPTDTRFECETRKRQSNEMAKLKYNAWPLIIYETRFIFGEFQRDGKIPILARHVHECARPRRQPPKQFWLHLAAVSFAFFIIRCFLYTIRVFKHLNPKLIDRLQNCLIVSETRQFTKINK